MATRITNDISGAELSKRIRAGELFTCPKCQAPIKTIPEHWKPELPLHGAECPVDAKHFWIHWEDAAAMKAMRAKLSEIFDDKDRKKDR